MNYLQIITQRVTYYVECEDHKCDDVYPLNKGGYLCHGAKVSTITMPKDKIVNGPTFSKGFVKYKEYMISKQYDLNGNIDPIIVREISQEEYNKAVKAIGDTECIMADTVQNFFLD
jgi:hypothetical protein